MPTIVQSNARKPPGGCTVAAISTRLVRVPGRISPPGSTRLPFQTTAVVVTGAQVLARGLLSASALLSVTIAPIVLQESVMELYIHTSFEKPGCFCCNVAFWSK